MIGTSVDRYRILEELGHGGMSVVYRGVDTSLEREVALKVLHNHLARKLENRKRFHREAKAIARLRHPNILEVYDFSGQDEERSYIVMEYVRGQNLREHLAAHGPPPPEVAAMIAVEIARALGHAHDHGIIHRDLKPENVMVSDTGVVKLMDFGIAHVIDAETMTQTGSLLGSPAHMPPEMIEGERVDVRGDVFALGTVLYWLSTGQLPFEGANAPQVLRRVLEGHFEDPERLDPRIGRELTGIIRRCLARAPGDRYQTVAAACRELTALAERGGVTEIDEELARYFRAPESYVEDFEASIVPLLLERATRAQSERDVPTAVALFNRILAYDPDNAEVQARLDALCRRRDLGRNLAIAAAAALLLAGSAAVLWLMDDLDPAQQEVATSAQPGKPEVKLEETTSEPIATPPEVDDALSRARATSAAQARADEAASLLVERAEAMASAAQPIVVAALQDPRVRRVEPRRPLERPRIEVMETTDTDEASPPPEPQLFTYRFKVSPPAATLTVDGQAISPFKAVTQGLRLPAGRHELRAESPGCEPLRQVLEVDGPQQEVMPVTLKWKDGSVQIVSNTDALVWLDSEPRPKRIGRAGQNATFRFGFGDATSLDNEREVRLRVAPFDEQGRMGETQHHRVKVRPGQLTTVGVNFRAGR